MKRITSVSSVHLSPDTDTLDRVMAFALMALSATKLDLAVTIPDMTWEAMKYIAKHSNDLEIKKIEDK